LTHSATTTQLVRPPVLERAVAKDAGARVARNARLADMNLPILVPDARRIEFVCNGLPLRHGAQLAVDTTCINPVTRSGEARPEADSQPGLALQQATRRKRSDTYPELSRSPRCRFVAFAVEIGGRRARSSPQASCTSASCACARCRSVGSAGSRRGPRTPTPCRLLAHRGLQLHWDPYVQTVKRV